MRQLAKKILYTILKTKKSFHDKIAALTQKTKHVVSENCISLTTTFGGLVLFLLILFMLVWPLPPLPSPGLASGQLTRDVAPELRGYPSLDTYLEPLKTRTLFKPSIPIPTKKNTAKTTAQQLAERLKFLGTTDDRQNLNALIFIPERGPEIFEVGDHVAEFVLKKVQKDTVILELGNEQIILSK